jgi:SAM-dependent methyltransferase
VSQAPRDPADGEIEFSDGELAEMDAIVLGREAGRPRRRSRSMLRVPADEIARPTAEGAGGTPADRSGPATGTNASSSSGATSVAGIEASLRRDELVEHAFSNGARAEGLVPALLAFDPSFAAESTLPDADESLLEPDVESEPSAPTIAEAEADAEEVEPEDTRVEESPFEGVDDARVAAALDVAPTAPRRAPPPEVAALVRAVISPDALDSDPRPIAPAVLAAIDDVSMPVLSSAPPPSESAAARPVAVTPVGGAGEALGALSPTARALANALGVKAPPRAVETDGDATDEELDSAALEEAEDDAASVTPPTQRSLTPVPPPPPPAAPALGRSSNGAITAVAANGTPDGATATAGAATATAATPGAAPPPAPPAAHGASPAAGAATPAPAPSAPPPPPPAPSRPAANAPPAPADASPLRGRKKRRMKQWFEEVFDDDFLRTLPTLTPRQTEREAQFIIDALDLQPGAAVLDLGCGHGRHAMALAQRGFKVTGLDLSLPLLIRAADNARRASLNVNFIHGDMRETTFEEEFDAAYCMFTTFGYFDDDTNRKVAANLSRALKPGGKLLLDVVNRDYLVRDLPTRVWWQGDGCVVLEEVDFNYFSSRLQVQRSIIYEDGRQMEHEISIRAYSLHEIGKVLHHSGFRVTEVSGGLTLRGKFFGAVSRQILVCAEKKTTP